VIYWIYELPVWAFGLMVAAVLLIAMEVGAWNGRRLARMAAGSEGYESRKRSDLEVGALLALMGLVLAFTYSFSLSRIDLRKQALVQEANAIGTAFLRADLLPEPGRTELRERLVDYARTRVMSDEARQSVALVEAAIGESLVAQAKLWPAMKNALSGDVPGHLQILTVQAINDVLDAHTTRMAVGSDRFAPSVFFFMIVLATLSVAFAAQTGAEQGSLSRGRISVFVLVLSGLIFIIIDFDNSSRGLIRLNQGSLTNLIAEMDATTAK